MAKILIAEDDRSFRALCHNLLESQNHLVRCECSGDAFLAAIPEFKPDLLVIDMAIPGRTSGIDLCRGIRKHQEHAKLPIIMLSTATDDEEILKGIDSGADEYITKPIRESEFLTKISLLLAKGARTRQFPMLAKGTFLGRYRLEELLGRNPDCASYLAFDIKSAETTRLALKIFNRISQSESDRSSFLLEADTLSRLNHPAIARILNYGLAADKIFVVTEFIEGDSLGDLLRKSLVSETTAIIVAKEVVKALAYLEANAMMHRNIKPSNIMISDTGEIKLVDFALKGATTQSTLRINDRMFGVIQFMSPERVGGEESLDIRSDIFSLGLTLYYAVSGALPLYSPDPVVMLQKYMSEEPPPLKASIPDVSSDFSDLIDRMLAKKPANRCGLAGLAEMLNKLSPE